MPRRYKQGADGQPHPAFYGKLPEEFSKADTMRFMVETDLKLSGCVSADTLAALRAEGYDHPPGGQKTGNEPGITHFGPCWPEVWKGGIHHRKETGQTEFSKAGADGGYRGQSPRTGGTGRAFPRTIPTLAV